MSDNVIFSITITNGYVLRQLFDFYSKLATSKNTPIALYFQENSIVMRLGIQNEKYTLVSSVGIYTDDIEGYYINPDLVSSKKKDKFCHFEILEPSSDVFKMIGKHDKVRLYKVKEGDDNVLYLKSDGSVSRIKQSQPVNIDDFKYFIDTFDDDAEPDVKVPLSFFSNKFKDIARDKGINHVVLKVSKRRLEIASVDDFKREIKSSSWESDDKEYYDDEDGEEYQTNVIIQIAKAVKSWENMSSNGIIKIYSPCDDNIRFSHHVGEYGLHDFYFAAKK